MNNLLTQKFPIAAFVLLFVLTLSCSHEPAVEPQEPGGTNVAEWNDSAFNGDAVMNQMTFCIGDGITVKRDAATRATTDIDGVADFETGDLVAVAVTQGTSAEEIKLYRVKSDGSLEYAGGDNNPLIWKSATNPATIRAWSYGTSTNLSYTLDAPESFDYSLTSNQQTNGYNELLYSKEAAISYATYSSSPIPLTFRHQLSRLVVNIEHDSPTSLAGTVSMGDNVNNTFPITARFDTIGGGSWTHTAYGAITPKGETAQSGYEATYSAVVFPGTYAQNTKMFTLTNTDGDYVYAVSDASGQTLTAGNQYNYTILVKDDLCRRNPLWWMAQYNMASNRTSLVASQSTSGQYVFTWNTAMTANVAGYHVPTLYEQSSIVPSDTDTGDYGTAIFTLTNSLSDPYEYSEIGCNIGGKNVAGSTSVFGKNADVDFYAVRFIGTPHASAWHYKIITSPCKGLLIESYLLDDVKTLSEAKAILTTLPSSTTFTGSYNAANANQTPESTVVTANCFVQRFLPACGTLYNKNGTTTSDDRAGVGGYYWTSTTNGSKAYHIDFYTHSSALREVLQTKPYAFSVRLYKDDYKCTGKALANASVGDYICPHGKAYTVAASEPLPCGKEKMAMIAYVGSVPGYFDTCIAIALDDATNETCHYSTANTAVNTYASNHPIRVNGTTYNTNTGPSGNNFYDLVVHDTSTPSRIKTSGTIKGWRMPTVTDWRYIFQGIGGPSATSPVGIYSGNIYGNSSTLRNMTGKVTALQNYYYWSSSEVIDAGSGAWVFNFNNSNFARNSLTYPGNIRAVFAY